MGARVVRIVVVACALVAADRATAQPAPYNPYPAEVFPAFTPKLSPVPPPPAEGKDAPAPSTPAAADKKEAPPASPAPAPAPAADTKLNPTWDSGGFRYKSADGSVNLHLGGRLMTDEVWWSQSPGLRQAAAPSVNAQQTGVGPGIGDLQDGFFIRRARFVADGTVNSQIDFKVEFDFENYNSIAFDESFVGVRKIPYLGMVRLGQSHVPYGLEAYTSSRFLPMMERSAQFDAFYQEFAPGIFTNTTFFDDRLTTQHMFHRIDNFQQFNGASFGDGKYAYSGRVSGLPVYEDDGRYLVHLGLAYQWRKGSPPADFNGGTTLATTPTVTTATDLFRFRARPGLRDAVGLQGDGARVVDTGNIIATYAQGVNAEFMAYRGPVWVQAEVNTTAVTDPVYPAAAGGTVRNTLTFWGAYAMAGVFLTGENRGYDKPMGKYGRVVPRRPFNLLRDKDGCLRCGPGAWELLYRYSYVNLNSDTVQGGTYGEHTVGVNWYWTATIKLQANYLVGQRVVPAGAAGGTVQGFGLRGALEF